MLLISFLTVIGLTFSNGERLHEQIYSSIEGGAACFRRLNGTHQAGCSSTDKGAVGVVQMIKDVNDANWIIYNATAGPYMAIVSTEMFHNVIELFMGAPDNVAGVLIYDNATDSPSAFTHESRCPNEYSSGPGSQCSTSKTGGFVWNEGGSGLLRRDIPFPIFFLPESRAEEIDKIKECYEKFNLDRDNQRGNPLCSVQLNSFMFAAVNSEVCRRRSATSAILSSTKVCDPLGDYNVYYSLFPRKQDNEGKEENITFVTARIDSATLFDGISPGAASSVVGMVTLLSAAITLSQLIPVTDADLYENNVLFTLFNGESFDYIGSQRVAYDLSGGMWPPAAPLDPADIKLHVELGQIGGSLAAHVNDTTWPLYAFAPYDTVIPEINDFINLMSTNANEYNMSLNVNTDTVANLPPSSLHSFRRILTNITLNGDLPELLITDHEKAFTNLFYQSALDEYEKIGFAYHNITVGSNGMFLTTEELLASGTMKDTEVQVKISRLATALARTLYQKVVGTKYAGNITASSHLVDEMLYCFLRSQACRLLAAAEYAGNPAEDVVSAKPAPLYVGVAAWPGTAPVLAGHLLALLPNHTVSVKDKDACDKLDEPGFTYYWLKGWNNTGECFQTTMNFSQALSPAFIEDDYDMSSGLYSTWTESVWQAMWARVFVTAGGGGARAAALAGAGATLLAALVTFWAQRHKDILFAPLPGGDDATSGILRTVNC